MHFFKVTQLLNNYGVCKMYCQILFNAFLEMLSPDFIVSTLESSFLLVLKLIYLGFRDKCQKIRREKKPFIILVVKYDNIKRKIPTISLAKTFKQKPESKL